MNRSHFTSRHSKKRPWLRISLYAIATTLFGVAALIGPTEDAEATRQQPGSSPLLGGQSIASIQLPPKPLQQRNEASTEISSNNDWTEITVQSGDNLSVIFDRLKISPQTLLRLTRADRSNNYLLRKLRPKQQLRFLIRDGQLESMDYVLSATRTVHYIADDATFRIWDEVKETEIRISTMAATITDSLFLAAQQAGLSDNLIMELVGIFGWDIDFALDIRSGDTFSLIYEEHFLDGEKFRDGAILAAEFTNQGRGYTAILHRAKDGSSNYYSPSGHSMRKAFLRSPVDFRRISSKFSRERYHPVLGKRRPHKGVDYAATTGTPIKASGDGKVIFKGRKGGYGRTLILQHGGKFTTLYAHMSSYKRGVKKGSRVKQGQTIGFVGRSGLATGPHLHYEFRVNGVHRNPLKVKFPNAAPIKKVYREAFSEQSKHMTALLQVIKSQVLALNES